MYSIYAYLTLFGHTIGPYRGKDKFGYIMEGNYKDGKKDGLWKRYYKNSEQLNWTVNYKDGEHIGESIVYHENGNIDSIKNHKADEEYTIYHDDEGRKKEEGCFKDSKQDGKWIMYHENGQIACEEHYEMGVENGRWIFYDEKGSVVEEQIWLNGKDISLYSKIIELLKERNDKMSTSDIDAFLGTQDIDRVKKDCEELYRKGEINRTGNYRYFILTEEKKTKKTKTKSEKVEKYEAVDVKQELKKYKEMLDEGLIDKEDYEAKKDELLGL